MKKALSAVLAVVLVLSVCFSVPMIASANDTDPLNYVLNSTGDGYIVESVKDTNVSGNIVIPAEFDIEKEKNTIVTYAVTVADITGGTVEAPKTAAVGSEITLTVTPESGKELTALTYTVAGGQAEDIDLEDKSFVMPAGDVTINATFATTYTVAVATGITDATVTVDKDTAIEGAEITVTVADVTEGKELTALTYTVAGSEEAQNIDTATMKFTMPAGNVTVNATFAEVTAPTSSAEGTGDATEPTTVDVNGFTVTIPAIANGEITGAVAEDDETTVVLTVNPANGYRLKADSLKYVGTDDTQLTGAITELVTGTTNKYTVTPSANITIAAAFEAIPSHGITVETGIENGTVTAPATALEGSEVTVTVTDVTEGYELETLTYTVDGSEEAENISIETKKFTMPAGDVTINATFAKVNYTVTKPDSVENGTITIDKATANMGDTVTITLTANADSVYCAGSLKYNDGKKDVAITTAGAEDNTFTFTMPAGNVTISAMFIKKVLPVVGIAKDAFKNCANIESISIPATVTEIGANAFVGCAALEKFIIAPVENKTPVLSVDETGVLFKGNTLVAFPAASIKEVGPATEDAEDPEETYIIPKTVTIIAAGAFASRGNVDYVFYNAVETGLKIEDNNDALKAQGVLHYNMEKHDETKVETLEATCTTKGRTDYKCSVCHTLQRSEPISINANAHSFKEDGSDFVIVTPATCENDGVEKRVCTHKKADGSECGHTEKRIIEATGHTLSEGLVTVEAANCGETGFEAKICTVEGCDYYDPSTKADLPISGEHVVVDTGWTSKTEETCTTDGTYTGICKVCDKEFTKTVPQLGHAKTEAICTATCTEAGYTYYNCTRCNATELEKVETPALNHPANKLVWKTVSAPTCCKAGEIAKFCSLCGLKVPGESNENINIVEATGNHDYKLTNEVEATCSAEGSKTYACSNKDCTATKTEKLAKLDCTPAEELTTEASTCKKAGRTYYKCTVCNEIIESTITALPIAAHVVDYDATTTTDKLAPTHTTKGSCKGVCTGCGETVTVTLDEIPHVYTTKDDEGKDVPAVAEPLREPIGEGEDAKTALTCTKDGYVAVYCTIEGCNVYDPETLEFKEHEGHKVTDWDETKDPAKCGVDGSKTGLCTVEGCENSVEGNPVVEKIPALEHDFETGTEIFTKAPTCKEEGYTAKICAREGCNVHDEENKTPIAKLTTHNFGDNVQSATLFEECGKVPYYKRYCDTCEIDIEIPTEGQARQHLPENEFTIDTPATCLVDGSKSKHCAYENCGEIIESTVTVVEAAGHVFAKDADGDELDWTVTANATCTNAGSRYKVCTYANCDFKDAESKVVEVIPATGHRFSDEVTRQAPTCDADGFEYRKCTKCDAQTGYKVLWKTGHNYSEEFTPVEGQEATCQAPGKVAKHCTNGTCEAYDKTSIKDDPIKPHNYEGVDWKIATKPTCATKGQRYKDCNDCKTVEGRLVEEISTRPHDVEYAEIITVEARCEIPGKKYQVCPDCNQEVIIETYDALEHDYKWETTTPANCTTGTNGVSTGTCQNRDCPKQVITKDIPAKHTIAVDGYKPESETTYEAPTCLKDGWREGFCSVCDAYVHDPIPTTGHNYGDWVTDEAATCLEDGTKYRICQVEGCEDREDGVITHSGHNYKWLLIEDATCGEPGSMVKKCINEACKDAAPIETVEIPATGKHPANKLEDFNVTAPTCLDEGKKDVKCKDCGVTVKTNVVIPAAGHKYTAWNTTVEETCVDDGIRTRNCSVCLKTFEEKLPKLGHDEYIVTDLAAKCTEKGKQHTACNNCDWESPVVDTDPLEHDFVDADGNALNTCEREGCDTRIIEYTATENGVIITKSNVDYSEENDNQKVVIPTTLDGKTVIGIGEKAFLGAEITEVVIPATVTTIGAYAFAKTELTMVSVPETVTTIGDYAFGFDVEVTTTEATETTEATVEITDTKKVDDFVMYGVAESAAETWAQQGTADDITDDVKFVALKDVYTLAADVKGETAEEAYIEKNANDIFVVTRFADDETKTKEQQIEALVVLPVPEENTADYTTDVESSIDVAGYYGTGTKIVVKDKDGKVIDEVVIAIKGDINGDSVCDVLDCMMLQLAVNSGLELNDASVAAGDYATSAEGPAITIDDLNGIVNQACPRDRTPRYSVNVATVEGGTITANPATKILAEATVTLTVAPAEGKQLKAGSLSVKNGDTAIEVTAGATAGTYTFAMPAGDVTVTAEFEAIPAPTPVTYTVTVPAATDDGSVTTDKETAEEGATVTLTAAPATGKKVKALTVKAGETAVTVTPGTGENANKYTFTMPAADVTVTVEFEAVANSDAGNTDNGNTDNGNTNNGNTDNGNTDNGNTNTENQNPAA